jgi:hypothetical protein
VKKSAKPPKTVFGRVVRYGSPAKHPEQSDPLAPPPRRLSRLDIADFSRNRRSAAGAESVGKREPAMDYTEGGPRRNAGGSVSHNEMRTKRGPLKGTGKRGWKQN